MKTLLTDYIFNPGAQTITFPGFTDLLPQGFLLVTNSTTNAIIYNFASPALGGVVAGNTLTLTFDTTTMSADDDLQIYYDDGIAPANLEDAEKFDFMLRSLLKQANDLPIWYDIALNALRITGAVTVTGTLTTVTTVTTVGSLTNQASMGGQPADQITFNLAKTDWALTTRNLLNTVIP